MHLQVVDPMLFKNDVRCFGSFGKFQYVNFICRRPAFSDYISVSYDYGESKKKFGHVTKDLEIMQSVHKPNMTSDVVSTSN